MTFATTAQTLLEQWELRRDGEPHAGPRAYVLPVRTADGAPAALKIGAPGAASEHEHLVLRRWSGDGAVRLLRADPHRRALLLERLRPESLDTLRDVDACRVIADLYRRIHVPAMPQLPTLPLLLEQWAADFDALPRSGPLPHRLVEQVAALSRELVDEPADRVVHGNLHSGNVLAADRAPWLVIAPRSVNGDPHFDLAPMLWHRWDDLAGHVRDGVQRRFFTLVDAAGLDEDRARAWVLVRVVHAATGVLHADPTSLTRLIALAKAVRS